MGAMVWDSFEDIKYRVHREEGAQSALVFVHGYGADAQDLEPLAFSLHKGPPSDWFFPRGVLKGPLDESRAWFPLYRGDLDQSPKDLSQMVIRPNDEVTIQKVCHWLNHLGQKYKKVFLCGFSQGAVVISHCFHRLDFPVSAMVLLSGTLICASAIQVKKKPNDWAAYKKIPFFQSHGLEDQVLNVEGGKLLFDHLSNLGLVGNWMQFQGGHEIPISVLTELGKFFQIHHN